MIVGISKRSKRIVPQVRAKPRLEPIREPGLGRMLINAVTAAGRIAKSGFARVRPDERERRRAKCLACEYWDAKARKGLGKCRVCGCTRWKQPWSAEMCPKGKWRMTQRDQVVGQIVDYYRSVKQLSQKPLPDLSGFALTNRQHGLGDTVIMSDVAWRSAELGRPVHVWSQSTHVAGLQVFNGYIQSIQPRLPSINVWDLYSKHDCGNGHLVQRLSRAFGLPVELLPKPKLVSNVEKVTNRVILHFEPGKHAISQRSSVHPLARLLYPASKAAIEAFVRERGDLEFIQIGSRPVHVIEGADHRFGLQLDESMRMIASASWFLGIISGPMHAATAFGARGVVIINFPRPEQIFLPTLVTTGQVEEEWFYPQNVHLHQEGDGPLVPRLSVKALHAAFNGEVYPFWSHDYLHLIHEIL